MAIGGTRHGGVGYVEQEISLETARLKGNVGGIDFEVNAYVKDDPNWKPRTPSVQFVVVDTSSASQTVGMAPVDATIGTLSSRVPGTWTEATLEMEPILTSPATAACLDPTLAIVACVPDPIRFYLGDLVAKDTQDHFLTIQTQQRVPVLDDPLILAINYFMIFDDLLGHWVDVGPQGGCVQTACSPVLDYLNDYPAIAPSAYQMVCDLGWASCYSLDTPPRGTAQESSNPEEVQKQNALLYGLRGRLSQGDQECGGPGTDCWAFGGGVRIDAQTKRKYKQPYRTVCDYYFTDYGPWRCYGFADDMKDVFDGLGVAWPGSWFIAPPTTGKVAHYDAEVSIQGNQWGCFAPPGQGGTRVGLTWDSENTLFVEDGKDLPGDWNGSGGGLTNIANSNQSGGMKARQAGAFYDGVNFCHWAVHWYHVGGWLYQYPNETEDPGEVSVQFTHGWTNTDWNWSFGCGTSYSCSFSVSPHKTEERWVKFGRAKPHKY